jgi:hypothetical protein
MATFFSSSRFMRGGIIILDPIKSMIIRIIPLQYNPDSLSRTLQVQGVGEGGDRSEALRLKGPPVETIKIEAEIDATDQLERPDQNQDVKEIGIHAQLAALETLIYPSSDQMFSNNQLAQSGKLEIAPMEAPLTLFIWSKTRILPVRLTEFSITEEAFDTSLNPIRAKVSLGMRVLSVNDLGFNHKGGSLYMLYHQQKERFADRARTAGIGNFGIGGI